MHDIHRAIIAYVREHLNEFPEITGFSDDDLLRRVFCNYRDNRGLRLSSFGLSILSRLFQSYKFTSAEPQKVRPSYLNTLDDVATFPYYISADKVVLFDALLASRLALANGDIAIFGHMHA